MYEHGVTTVLFSIQFQVGGVGKYLSAFFLVLAVLHLAVLVFTSQVFALTSLLVHQLVANGVYLVMEDIQRSFLTENLCMLQRGQ